MSSVCVCAFFCVCVQVEALRRVDHPSKESYRLSLIKKLRKLSPMLQKREQAPKCGSNEEEKKTVNSAFTLHYMDQFDFTKLCKADWTDKTVSIQFFSKR
jgi:hypothetical protein